MKRVFCHSGCRDAWLSDMRHGLIYGAVFKPNGTWKNHRQFAEDAGLCPYDSVKVVTKRKRQIYRWHEGHQ